VNDRYPLARKLASYSRFMAGAHRGIHLADRSEVIYLSASIGCFTREADSTATETPEKLMATLWTPAGR
jgi:hypothetical protein